MPHSAPFLLRWSAAAKWYELGSHDSMAGRPLQEDEWLTWLAEHSSFAFQGQHGHLSLLKEARDRGGGYWYAYRSLNGRTVKKYAGRSRDLNVARLEELAHALAYAGLVAPGGKTRQAGSPSTRMSAHATPAEPVRSPVAAPAGATGAALPLLRYKLQPPRLHPSLIVRTRLLEQLEAAVQQPVTLLSAPAGFGKTTLARQWLAAHAGAGQLPAVAWVSLDPAENDLLRFWRYLIGALQEAQAEVGAPALATLFRSLSPPYHPPDMESALTLLLNDLTCLPDPTLLVLDDYHVITDPRVHQSMTFLLEHLPDALHVLLLSRGAPPLLLTRLRARGELAEIQRDDVRFTVAEVDAFMQQALALSLPPETLARLTSHLEGWAAGLRLLTLAQRGRMSQVDLDQHLTNSAGSQPVILDYFITEVLSAQSEAAQDFLLRTSVLPRLNSSLCVWVTGRRESAQQLGALANAGLFLEAVDARGDWYRYHGLFAEAMRTIAERRLGSDILHALSRKASTWFEAQGSYAEAIEAALQAQDMPRAAALIGRLIESRPLHELQDAPALLLWLQQLPEDLLTYSPWLCHYYAAALLYSGKTGAEDYRQLERLLQMAEAGWRAQGDAAHLGEALTLRALLASRQGAHERALALAREALSCAPGVEHEWRMVGLGVVGIGALQAGQLNDAEHVLQKALAHWEAVGNAGAMRGIMLHVATLCYEQAALQKAGALFRRALADARAAGDSGDMALALQGLATIAYERNDLTSAEQAAQEALAIGLQVASVERQVEATLALAQVAHASGRRDEALERCAALSTKIHAGALAADTPLQMQLNHSIELQQARFHLAANDVSKVEHWLRSRSRPDERIAVLRQDQDTLIVARLLIAQGDSASAQAMLMRLNSLTAEAGRGRTWLEAELLQAEAAAARKQLRAARRHLYNVLAQAHTQGFLRLFLDAGQTIAALLHSLLPHLRNPPLRRYAHSILEAFVQQRNNNTAPDARSSQLLLEPLSPHEHRVLRLLMAGLSNRAIAAEQIVSINTIRTQVQSIYRKLGVNNRVEACEVARHLHLVDAP